MPKFRVIQEVEVEADGPKEAAGTANSKFRSSNVARYDVIDEAGYTFHVSLEGTDERQANRPG